MITQTGYKSETPKSSFYHQTKQEGLWADSSVWNECLTCTQEAAGSNPARSTSKLLRFSFPEKNRFQELITLDFKYDW